MARKSTPHSTDEQTASADPAKRETLKKLAALGLLSLVDVGALSSCGRRALSSRSAERKLIILGLDGLDPRAVGRMMGRGELPNMSRLREVGGFRTLASSIPPQSPVAWTTFVTGRDPGGHGIYDFIQRDPATYLPHLSIARTEAAERSLSLGGWEVPLSRGKVEMLRSGPAFWDLLTEQGVPVTAYRVPANFPPRDTGAKQLAGLGAPDLRGTYGEFSYYTDAPRKVDEDITGGAVYQVSVINGRVKARLMGPANTLRADQPETHVEFDIWIDRDSRLGKIAIQDTEILLREGEWSDWVQARFPVIPHVKHISGICRFYLKEVRPYFKLYVTPINVDPMEPALPITAPASFAGELAAKFGRFYTQGFPHDVKALRQDILDDGEYLQQAELAMGEARRMYESALNELERGVLFYYFATTDRNQHMFWRTMDPNHPAYDAALAKKYGSVMGDCYRVSDKLVGQAMEACDDSTTLIVLSDHGFAPYYRSFNLNSWLAENGYLAGVYGWRGGASIFANADWRGTAAYGLGFNALYLNQAGREREGIVGPEQRDMLARRIADELRKVRDPETGSRVIENVYLANEVYARDQAEKAPDLVVGYASGYRCSDDSILGEVSDRLIEENLDKWSGDHCIDRSLVPGMLLTNNAISAEAPALPDVTATALSEFEVEVPDEMTGKPVW
jgi:predicted AlkP superfamily phosphohydrolase/phosphomutase